MKALAFRATMIAFVWMALLFFTPVAQASDWPGWRGPTGLGYTDEKDLPLTWDGKTGKNILWKAPLYGDGRTNPEASSPGWSCPIVWRDRVFITTAQWPAELLKEGRKGEIARKDFARHHVLCYRASDGKLLWDTLVPPGKCLVDGYYHGYAVPTPVTDGKHVFALFGSAVTVALDFDGKIVWREELPRQRDPRMDGFLIYGANGYTGSLIARTAINQGLRPILAARNAVAVERLGRELGLEYRVFDLDDPVILEKRFQGLSAVLHCAGPFVHTSKPLADACLRSGVHYLDVTGEVSVFEALAARDGEAKASGIMLLPGAGFDVVPSDCLAAHLKRRLPSGQIRRWHGQDREIGPGGRDSPPPYSCRFFGFAPSFSLSAIDGGIICGQGSGQPSPKGSGS